MAYSMLSGRGPRVETDRAGGAVVIVVVTVGALGLRNGLLLFQRLVDDVV
jgi:hypothetical protein